MVLLWVALTVFNLVGYAGFGHCVGGFVFNACRVAPVVWILLVANGLDSGCECYLFCLDY